MKSILIALAVLFSVQLADAQVTPDAARKALDKAIEATRNEKKAAKPDTWLKLAAAYMDAYNAPMASAWIGAQRQELQLIMKGQKPRSVESVVLGGEPCTKEVYADKEFYFNQNGQLVLINVTRPVVKDALDGALSAYKKAWEVDVKQSKAKYDQLKQEIESLLEHKQKLNKKFFSTYSRFIQEGTWSGKDYIDDNKYFSDAQVVLKDSTLPKVSYTFSIIDVSGLEGYELYKLKLGDKTWAEDPEFFGYDSNGNPYREEITVTEVVRNLDSPDKNSVKVQNYRNQFQDLFQKITATT